MAAMAERLGLMVRVGIAGDKVTAHIAALIASINDEPTIVARAAPFLAPLPVEALFAAVGLSASVSEMLRGGCAAEDAREKAELVAVLRRWGVRRIGGLGTLPSG